MKRGLWVSADSPVSLVLKTLKPVTLLIQWGGSSSLEKVSARCSVVRFLNMMVISAVSITFSVAMLVLFAGVFGDSLKWLVDCVNFCLIFHTASFLNALQMARHFFNLLLSLCGIEPV